MTEPTAGGPGLRSVVAPESIGALLAVVVVVALVLGGALPAIGGATPSSGPETPGPSATASASTPSLSTTTRNALLAALGVNQRLAAQVPRLEAAIDGDDATGATINAILRTMNQDVPVGLRAADLIVQDPLTATLGEDLRAFYTEVARQDEAALGLSVQQGAAYRAAAAEIVALLAGLPALDDRIADALEGRPGPTGSAPSASPAATTPAPSAAANPSPSAAPNGSDPPSAAPSGPNLVTNGSFDTDLAGWTLELDPGAAAAATHEATAGRDGSGAARIDITSGSAARAGIAFTSPPFEPERGRPYRVTALLRSTAVREVRLRIATLEGRTTTARTFTVGTTWGVFEFETTELLAGSTSRFALDLGRGDATVWLDDVTIVPLGG